jgi:hypothetical protein
MVGYVPPTSLPSEPKRTLVAEDKELVWSQLVSLLESSAFEVDLIDESKDLIVARYSGDPEPFIDCGSIVTHQNGTLGQIDGSAPSVELNYALDQEPVVLNRTLNLDSRIIISLDDRRQGTVIETDTTYVVTKIVDVVDGAGNVRDGSRETISFKAGNRGEFSKGTACQPNGSLDLAVLKSLPKIVGSDDIDRAALSTPDLSPAETEEQVSSPAVVVPDEKSTAGAAEPPGTTSKPLDVATSPPDSPRDGTADAPSPNGATFDWVLPDQGLPNAAKPEAVQRNNNGDVPPPVSPDSSTSDENKTTAAVVEESGTASDSASGADERLPNDTISNRLSDDGSNTTIVDDTTRKLLQSLDCGGEEWHFCDLVELTTPYRRRNIEELFGLTVNTTESFTSQIVGSDLKLDVLFPSFPSYLHIVYARRDGTIETVISSPEVWPADIPQQFTEEGLKIPGPSGLAMIVAIASESPLFNSPPDAREDAAPYLSRLKQRLLELETENPQGRVAASQLLIFVENGEA